MKKNSVVAILSILVVLTIVMTGCHNASPQPSVNSSSSTTNLPSTTAANEKPPTEAGKKSTELMRQGALSQDSNTRIAFFKQGVQADPTNMSNLSELGFALKNAGKSQEALKVFQQLGKSDDPTWQNAAKVETKEVLQKMQPNH